MLEHVPGKLGTRADTDEMGVGDLLLELLLGQGFGVVDDIGVARRFQGVHRGLVDAFQ